MSQMKSTFTSPFGGSLSPSGGYTKRGGPLSDFGADQGVIQTGDFCEIANGAGTNQVKSAADTAQIASKPSGEPAGGSSRPSGGMKSSFDPPFKR